MLEGWLQELGVSITIVFVSVHSQDGYISGLYHGVVWGNFF